MRTFDIGLNKLEYDFNNAFLDQIKTINFYEEEGNPLTLEEVLTMGFNYIYLNGTYGFKPEDFSEEELKTKVSYDYWDFDEDCYRTVYLKSK